MNWLIVTKKVYDFTSRLLDIHSKILEMNKKEEICLGLHRSDYMLDEQTKLLLQTELNTISTSSHSTGSLVNKLHRCLLDDYGHQLGLHSHRIPVSSCISQFAQALAKAWDEYNQPNALIMVVVQTEERNMYDQHWLLHVLKETYPLKLSIFVLKSAADIFKHGDDIAHSSFLSLLTHNVKIIRKTLAEIDREARVLPDGTLTIDDQEVAVVYFRAGYSPADYPSESEWRARLIVEQPSAVKCPSISYHLVGGTKKIQQELAKPNVLERFLDDKEAITRLRNCFAGLWSLDDLDTVNKAIETPELFVMKPQREGGGNNIYGDAMREKLLELRNGGAEESAAYILMQRIFPAISPTIFI